MNKSHEEEQFTVLDYIDGIKVSGDLFSHPVNEYYALLYLKQGLDFIYNKAVKCDELRLSQINPNMKVFAYGNIPLRDGVPEMLLTCAFHWYAITACLYVETVGQIAHNNDKNRPTPLTYMKTVIPDVFAFRNKVAAHYVWTKKDPRDNDAERSMSIMPMLQFSDDSFFIAGFKLFKKAGQNTSTASLNGWSITKVHQHLKMRYWPEAK